MITELEMFFLGGGYFKTEITLKLQLYFKHYTHLPIEIYICIARNKSRPAILIKKNQGLVNPCLPRWFVRGQRQLQSSGEDNMKYHFLSLLLIFQFLDVSEEKKVVGMVIEKMSFLISVSQGHFERFVHSNHAAFK